VFLLLTHSAGCETLNVSVSSALMLFSDAETFLSAIQPIKVAGTKIPSQVLVKSGRICLDVLIINDFIAVDLGLKQITSSITSNVVNL
jgi:hypothetical protein